MRILFAEDEAPLNKALTKILQRNNYTVDSVFNGEDALNYLSSGLYDLAILDIMMPKLDGISVLKQLREQKNGIPVIMLTAKSQLEDKVFGLDQGADDYISKPFETEELLARIRAVLRRKGGKDTNVICYEDLSLDIKTYELSSNDKTVKLNHKEFQLTEYLMRHPKQVTSAERLMEKIWDVESNADLNVVWVYISGLRKKLVDIGSSVKIKTSRNLGYYLERDND